MKTSLAKNTTIYLVSNVLNSAIPFLLLPVLTRYLSPEDYGIVSIFQVIQSFLFVFIGINTSGAIAINFFKKSREEIRIYTYNVFLIITVSLIFFQSLTLIFSGLLSEALKVNRWVIIIAASSSFFVIINKINLVLWQVEKKPMPYGLMNIGVTVLNISFSLILIVLYNLSWEGRIIGIISANILSGLTSLVIINRRRYFKIKFNLEYIRDAMNYGLPLVPSNLSEWITKGLNRIFLATLISLPAAGLFTVGSQVAAVVTLISAAFYKSYLPFALEKLEEQKKKSLLFLTRYTLRFFIVIILFSILLGLASPMLFGTFIDVKYSDAGTVIFLNAIGYSFLGMFSIVSVFYQYLKKTKFILYISLIAVFINVILNYILISAYGFIGAAYAITATYLIKLLLGFLFLRNRITLPWDESFRLLFKKL